MKKRTIKKLLALITTLALLLTTFGTVLSAQETTEEIVAWVDSDDDGIIDEGENGYATLIDALEEGETDITLAKDHATDVTITVFTDGTVIDLGGHTLSTSEAFGNVDMINFQNNYSLTLKNGNIETAHNGDSIIWHNTDSTLTLDGITLTSSGTLRSADIWHTAGTLELIDSSVGIIYVYSGTKATLSGDVSVDEWSIGADAVFNVDPSGLNGFNKDSYEAVKSEESGLWTVISKSTEPEPEEIVAWADSDNDAVIDEGENTYATLSAALDGGETNIKLAKDHAIDGPLIIRTNGTIIDLGGYTLSTADPFNGTDMIGFDGDYNLIIKNGTIESNHDGDSVIWHNVSSTLTLYDVTITSSSALIYGDIYHAGGALELTDITVGSIYVGDTASTMLNENVSVDVWSIDIGTQFNVDPTDFNGFDKANLIAVKNSERELWEIYDINVYINNTFSLQTLEGASVRISKTKSGLRFKTQIYADDIADLVAIFGADNVQIGTLIAPSDKLSGTLTFEFGTSGIDYIDVVADYTLPFSSENGSNFYAGSITSIKPANLSRNFTAVGYVKITHNGSIFYLYSTSMATRSVSDVANAALTDFSDVEQGDYVNEIYTDMWSAYTPEERKMLAEFIPAVYTEEEFSAAKDKDGYIKLGADITISDHSTVSIGTFVILDLSGFDLTLTQESAFYLNDTLIICGEGNIHSEDYYAFFHGNGTMRLVGNAATISGAYESPIYWVSGGNIDLRDFTGESFVIEPAEDMPVDDILLPDGWKLYNADNNEVTTAIKWNVITAKPAISE